MTIASRYKTPAMTSREAAHDGVLWARMRDGNRDALAELYKNNFSALHNYGVSLCKDPDLVNDCIHELFSRLWTRHMRISAAINVKVYLCKSLQRIILNQILKRRRQSYDQADLSNLFSDSSEDVWIDSEVRKQRLSEINSMLHSLPKCQREVLFLKYFNDLSYADISEIMDLQLSSVYNLMSKAIEHLRQKMQFQASKAA